VTDRYEEWELMPPDWVCFVWNGTCAVAAQSGYLARLCRRNGRCLELGSEVIPPPLNSTHSAPDQNAGSDK